MAEMVGDVKDATGFVLMVKAPVDEPAGTVTVAGTVAAAVLLLERLITTFTAARPVRVTVPTELVPPRTLVGFSESVESAGARTVNVAFRLTPLAKAEMDEVVLLATGVVVTVKVAVRLPAATVILDGT